MFRPISRIQTHSYIYIYFLVYIYIYIYILVQDLHYVKTSIRCRVGLTSSYDDVINWKHFPRYWPFVRGIHRLPVNSPNAWVNNDEAGDLKRHCTHYDVTVMPDHVFKGSFHKWLTNYTHYYCVRCNYSPMPWPQLRLINSPLKLGHKGGSRNYIPSVMQYLNNICVI